MRRLEHPDLDTIRHGARRADIVPSVNPSTNVREVRLWAHPELGNIVYVMYQKGQTYAAVGVPDKALQELRRAGADLTLSMGTVVRQRIMSDSCAHPWGAIDLPL